MQVLIPFGSLKWVCLLYSVPVLCNFDALIENKHELIMSRMNTLLGNIKRQEETLLSFSLAHHGNRN
jgi:hypothetical protein